MESNGQNIETQESGGSGPKPDLEQTASPLCTQFPYLKEDEVLAQPRLVRKPQLDAFGLCASPMLSTSSVLTTQEVGSIMAVLQIRTLKFRDLHHLVQDGKKSRSNSLLRATGS